MTTQSPQLANLIAMDSPEAVMNEVAILLKMISPEFEITLVDTAFSTTVDLYEGRYPGYQACNTEYHDLRHTTDDFLAMARLIHGAVVEGESFPQAEIIVALIAALFHDVGYIQQNDDTRGTGAKYTIGHVQRGMDFLQQYGNEKGLSAEEIRSGQSAILCTDLAADIPDIQFGSRVAEILGKMLGTADLLAQMADRTYLEKLLFLYYEFKEGNVGDYEGEEDLLRKTISFFDYADDRLNNTLGGVDRYMLPHFSSRWRLDANLYQDSIDKHKDYLITILKRPDFSPEAYLKRGGIVKKVRSQYGPPSK